ncbi:MAG: DNA cytosine methyltransferase [Proteobacteria bacterium]|nr:DNA cytosine methyltransferase [Pseudomonadota bacterium]
MNVALRPDSINLISLCTGGAGLDLGIELAMPNARSVVLVEREAFAVSHLVAAMQQGLLAPAPLWSDVTTFNGRPWRGLVDGVIGGIPCQPHSLAGKRLGEDDERDLWSDARRIIVQSGAWFVLIENVRGMVTSGGFERVWRDLRRLGFEVEPGLFTAAEVGASHQRERLFILAVADRECGEWRPRSEATRQRCSKLYPFDSGSDVGNTDHARLEGHRQSGERAGERPAGPEPEFRSRRDSVAGASSAMGHAMRKGPHAATQPGIYRGEESRRSRHENIAGPGPAMADANVVELRREPSAEQLAQLQSDDGYGEGYLFPPGPSDLHGWRNVLASAPELEPAFRRVADGLASRLDIARVDRLRMLGNGVVPLEAAYAVRTLATRLARRSPGAERLVRMMRTTP